MDLSEFDIDFLSQKLSDNPQSPLFARLADLYLSKNQSSEALKLCENGVAAYSSYATGYVVLGKCYLALNENSKARLAFTQALHLAPFNQIARKLLLEIPATTDDIATETTIETPAVPQPVVEALPSPEPMAAEIPVQEVIAEPTIEIPEPVAEFSAEPVTEPEPLREFTAEAVTEPEPLREFSAEPEPVAQISVEPPAVEPVVPEIEQPVAQTIAQPEPSTQPAAPQTEPAEMLGLDEYLQRHSASPAPEKTMSLDEYLGVAPGTPASPAPAATELDSLAAQLENAGRITPQQPEPAAAAEESAPLDSTVITPTLAEIYATQGEYGAAIQAYEILMLSKPDERERFEKRIKELQAKLYDGG